MPSNSSLSPSALGNRLQGLRLDSGGFAHWRKADRLARFCSVLQQQDAGADQYLHPPVPDTGLSEDSPDQEQRRAGLVDRHASELPDWGLVLAEQ